MQLLLVGAWKSYSSTPPESHIHTLVERILGIGVSKSDFSSSACGTAATSEGDLN